MLTPSGRIPTLNLAGEEPLLLAIDDLHWLDRPSLRFVAYW